MTHEASDGGDAGRRARRAALAISPGVMFAGIAGGIAFPILPVAGLRAGLSLPFIGLILAANRIARIFASPAVGVLSDRLGGRRMLVVGLFTQIAVMSLYLAGTVAHRTGLYFLLARLLHGPGSAGVFVAAQVLALHAGGRLHGGMTSGVVRASMTAGLPVGLVVGGVLSERFGDRATFEAAIAAVAAATLAAWAMVPDLRSPRRARAGVLDMLGLLSNRRVLALGAINLATFFSATGVVLTTLVLLVGARSLALAGLGAQGTASLAMGTLVLVAGGAALVAGRLGDRRRAHSLVCTAGLALLVAGLLFTMVASTTTALLAAAVLIGAGSGAASPCLVALVARFVPSELSGSAVGAIQLLGDIGGSIGPIAGAALFETSTRSPFLASAAVVACALPVGLWLARAERAAGA